MLGEKPLGQESELKMQRQRFRQSSKKWGMPKMVDWWTDTPNRLFRGWWLQSETVSVILQVPTMGRMGKMRMIDRQSRASWAAITHPAGWWAQSRKWYSSAWTGLSRSRWSLMNWHNLDGRTQPTTSVKKITSKAHPISGYQQLPNRKQMMLQPHLHRQYLESSWSVLTLSSEYRKCQKGLLNREVVIFGYILGSHSRTRVYPVLHPPLSSIDHSFTMRSLLNS